MECMVVASAASRVTGVVWSPGKYNLWRKLLVKMVYKDALILEIKNGKCILSRAVNHLHFHTKNSVLIWFKGSKLGLLYVIVPPTS